MNVLTTLQENGPWLAMGELVKITGQDAATLRAELKGLIESNQVQQVGQKRGTKYGLADAQPPESKNDLDFKAEIIKVLEAEKGRVSRKLMCEKIGTYDAKIRASLLALVDEGIVLDNGKKKGQLFWLASHEKEGIVKPMVVAAKAVETLPKNEDSSENNLEIKDINEIVKMGINSLQRGEKLTIEEVKSHIMSCARHNFSYSQVSEEFHRIFKSKSIPNLKNDRSRVGGITWRTFYWMDHVV